MSNIVPYSEVLGDNFKGALLDDGSPYSGMGIIEFLVLQPLLLPNWNEKLQPVAEELRSRPFWQYGTGSHSTETRKIIGSIFLNVLTDNCNVVAVHHLIIDGSSQWIVDRNVTRRFNIEHIDHNKMILPNK